MVKCFVTGDNHFGRKFNAVLGEKKEELTEARYESLSNMVRHANEENCDLFFVTGDLFEKTDLIYIGGNNQEKGKEVVQRVVSILKDFKNDVLIIPGNHDYDDGSSSVWMEFRRQIAGYNNILVLNEFKPWNLGEINGSEVVVYSAYCQNMDSETNNLGWINPESIEKNNTINIGLAHGTIEDVSQDNEGKYFYMSKEELNNIPVDVWFIGHAHSTYPKNIYEDRDTRNEKIYNAGTHQPIHINAKNDGFGFIVKIEKTDEKAEISARKWRSGVVFFSEITVNTTAKEENSFRQALEKEVEELKKKYDPEKCIIRVAIKGSAKPEEYQQKEEIYEELTKDFLFRYPPEWGEFVEEITTDKIKQEFNEKSLVALFLNSFIEDEEKDPEVNKAELNMAYDLIRDIAKGK